MTPKEKAKEIYDKYYGIPLYIKTIKQCCNITIDEILKVAQSLNRHHTEYIRDEYIPYWEEVKQEVEKL